MTGDFRKAAQRLKKRFMVHLSSTTFVSNSWVSWVHRPHFVWDENRFFSRPECELSSLLFTDHHLALRNLAPYRAASDIVGWKSHVHPTERWMLKERYIKSAGVGFMMRWTIDDDVETT